MTILFPVVAKGGQHSHLNLYRPLRILMTFARFSMHYLACCCYWVGMFHWSLIWKRNYSTYVIMQHWKNYFTNKIFLNCLPLSHSGFQEDPCAKFKIISYYSKYKIIELGLHNDVSVIFFRITSYYVGCPFKSRALPSLSVANFMSMACST